jgi:hypothetical protein
LPLGLKMLSIYLSSERGMRYYFHVDEHSALVGFLSHSRHPRNGSQIHLSKQHHEERPCHHTMSLNCLGGPGFPVGRLASISETITVATRTSHQAQWWQLYGLLGFAFTWRASNQWLQGVGSAVLLRWQRFGAEQGALGVWDRTKTGFMDGLLGWIVGVCLY